MFDSNPVQGYFIDFEQQTVETGFQHAFCGSHTIPGADCPNCKRPLLLFIMLDATDTRLNLADMGVNAVPLLYCWRCSVAQGTFYYRVFVDGSVSLARFKSGPTETDFPYEDYPDYFPSACATLVAITPEDQKILRRINRGNVDTHKLGRTSPHLISPRHQIGGEPLLLQEDDPMICVACSQPMDFLACIADKCLDPRGLIGYEGAQVLYHLCRNCNMLAALNRAD